MSLTETLRSGNKVSTLVEQYSQLQGPDEVTSPSTPPRGHSPETMETDEQKYVSREHRLYLNA